MERTESLVNWPKLHADTLRTASQIVERVVESTYRVAQKSKPSPIFQKIALKIANEIRFLCKAKLWIKHYNTIRW